MNAWPRAVGHGVALGIGAVVTACAHPTPAAAVEAPQAETVAPLHYDRPDAWVCRPDRANDPCRTDLDATELRKDGTHVRVPFTVAAHPLADCFYVYPTVDMALEAGNHHDFTDTNPIVEATRAQVARFSATCRVFAPLYHQMTFGTYVASPAEHQRRFEVAFADVLAAFKYYREHDDDGRGIVLIGHSQGAQMVERLLQTVFDDDPALRARLVVAMPIGGDVQVAGGSAQGGTFKNIPLCASIDARGCVVAFGTFPPGGAKHPWPGPPPTGHTEACVNPIDPGGGKGRLTGAVFPTHSRYRDHLPGSDWADTPFILLRDFYSAWCEDGLDGFRYLAAKADPGPGDKRVNPLPLDDAYLNRAIGGSRLGLHILDMQLSQDDLVKLVDRKSAAALHGTKAP